MNLVDLVTRKDNYLMADNAGLTIGHYQWNDIAWRTIQVEKSAQPQIVIKNLYHVYSMQSMPVDIGWHCCARRGNLRVILENEDLKSERVIKLGEQPVLVCLPWNCAPGFLNEKTKLILHFELHDNETAQLLIHKKLSRDSVIMFARGQGVEIGPGPNPQIFNSDTISVSYVEETPAEKWAELYDKNDKYNSASADFSRYVIGTAWNLPQADNSLDFIFSSHTIEHLANPLGHLLRWKSKLRSGGKVIGVIPDATSTKDYLVPPSSLEQILDEFKQGITEPVASHYQRFALSRRNPALAEKYQATKKSIHVHYYTAESFCRLLQYCVKHLGFKDYSIVHSKNHKDFYFVLRLNS